MEKQTAVEWLAQELYEKFEMKGDGKVFDGLLEQAKQMHKEEIIKARLSLDRSNMSDFPQSFNNATDYYYKTFKSE